MTNIQRVVIYSSGIEYSSLHSEFITIYSDFTGDKHTIKDEYHDFSSYRDINETTELTREQVKTIVEDNYLLESLTSAGLLLYEATTKHKAQS